MAQIIYHKDYTKIDVSKKEELSEACMRTLREMERLKTSTPCSQMLTEKEWAPFRSFLILCDLHVMKFAGQLELIATDTENVFEAVMTLSRTAFDADDVERISVIFDASESFTILHAGENAFTLCATYSFT